MSNSVLFMQRLIPIPQRYVFSFMAFLALVISYNLRVSLNLAITEMVSHKAPVTIQHQNEAHGTCPEFPSNVNSSAVQRGLSAETFNWSERRQGLILSSFYWGYVITHIPGGIVSDKLGGKYVLGFGMLSAAVFTLLIPPAARFGSGWLVFVRFMSGFGEGVTIPGATNLMAKWFPPEEKTLLVTFVLAGSHIGTVTGTLISGSLLDTYTGQWPIVFYFFGTVGVIWTVIFFLLCYASPEKHLFITEKEKQFLKERITNEQDIPPPPWPKLMTSLPVLAIVLGQLGHDWGLFIMVTDLPKYMKEVLKFSVNENGILSALPFFISWLVSMLSSWLCNKLIVRKSVTITNARRIFTGFAQIVSSMGLIGASYAGCYRTTVIILFCVGVGAIGSYYPGIRVNVLDLSPNYAGTLMGIVNGIGALSGIVAPYLVGVLAPNHSLPEWRQLFWITVGINVVSLIIFVIFGSGEVQPWNEIPTTEIMTTQRNIKEEEEEDERKRGTITESNLRNKCYGLEQTRL